MASKSCHYEKNAHKVEEPSRIIHLDNLTAICGFFNSDTCANNGYGCNHPQAEEFEYVKANDSYRYVKEEKVRMALLRQKFGSYHNILKNKQDAWEWIQKAQFTDDELLKINVKKQGKCYSFSCPIASEADLEDLKKYDIDLYYDWKDEKHDPSEMGAELMVFIPGKEVDNA